MENSAEQCGEWLMKYTGMTLIARKAGSLKNRESDKILQSLRLNR